MKVEAAWLPPKLETVNSACLAQGKVVGQKFASESCLAHLARPIWAQGPLGQGPFGPRDRLGPGPIVP